MRLLFVSYLPIWSSGTHQSGGPAFSRTLEFYRRQGCEIHLITPEPVNAELAPPGVAVSVAGSRGATLSSRGPWRTFWSVVGFPVASLAAFRRLHRSFVPDVIYGYEVEGILAASLIHCVCRRPLVTRYQGTILAPIVLGGGSLGQKLRFLAHLLAFRVPASLAIVTDDGTRGDEVMRRLNAGQLPRTRFWRNGVDREASPGRAPDVRAALGLDRADPLLMTVSRLVEWKRVDRAIDALALLHATVPGCRLAIIGDGAARASLEKRAAERGVAHAVRFLGAVPQPDVRAHLAQADVFLSLYDLSNLGNPLMEAMQVGLPIVTIDNGGTGSVIADGETGILLPAGDPPAVADAVGRLLDDERLRTRLGSNARAFAEAKFWSWEDRLQAEHREVTALGQAGAPVQAEAPGR